MDILVLELDQGDLRLPDIFDMRENSGIGLGLQVPIDFVIDLSRLILSVGQHGNVDVSIGQVQLGCKGTECDDLGFGEEL